MELKKKTDFVRVKLMVMEQELLKLQRRNDWLYIVYMVCLGLALGQFTRRSSSEHYVPTFVENVMFVCGCFGGGMLFFAVVWAIVNDLLQRHKMRKFQALHDR